ncbi:MAG: ATP-dependent DNA helicase, partial [Defluviitaleaceae bacterium]|nr:ATP-dependent DNA helicase [Defluviitaleaceae bacterium]
VNEAIKDCVTNERVITRTTVESYARRHNVCPAEFQLDVSLFADAVVCDYNHVYDPKAKLQRFFQFGGDYILLNDEAHNLIDRAREMFSAGLYRADFSAYRKKTDKKHPLKKIISKLIKTIKETCSSEDKNPFTVKEKPENLLSVIFEFAEEADIYFQYNQDTPQDDELLTLYFNSLDFLRVSELFDDRYATYIEPANGYIKLFCLDPSYLLAAEQKKSRACVFFSATLTPLAYFKNILGGGTDDYTLKLASPFPRENLCLVVDDRVSTKYKDRSRTYGTVADRLHDFVSGKKAIIWLFSLRTLTLPRCSIFLQKSIKTSAL